MEGKMKIDVANMNLNHQGLRHRAQIPLHDFYHTYLTTASNPYPKQTGTTAHPPYLWLYVKQGNYKRLILTLPRSTVLANRIEI